MADKSNNLATMASTIKAGIETSLKDTHTAMPGTIVSFNAAKQTASVQPAIKRIFRADTGEAIELTPRDLPVLINVPVQFPRGGGFSLTFPVTAGDECLIVFCERSIDRWHKFAGTQEPGAKRFHDLSDGTCFVGLSSEPNKVPNYDATNTQLKKDDETAVVTLQTDGIVDIKGATKVISDAPDTETTGNLKVGGNLEVVGTSTFTGTMTHAGKTIDSTHGHTQGPDSDGDTEAPISGVT